MIHNFGIERDDLDIRDHDAGLVALEFIREEGLVDMSKEIDLSGGNISKVDLSEYCLPVIDQGATMNCVQHAATNMIGVLQQKKAGLETPVSRLSIPFLYYTTKRLMGRLGNVGTKSRICMKAFKVFGAPPDKYWPVSSWIDSDQDPGWFPAQLAEQISASKYVRHDSYNRGGKTVLGSMRSYIESGVPCILGYYSFEKKTDQHCNGLIRYPSSSRTAYYAHGVCIVGYDDDYEISRLGGEKSDKGAFKFQNCWDTGWGNEGFGWLPYKFVESGFAFDIWSITRLDLMDLSIFE